MRDGTRPRLGSGLDRTGILSVFLGFSLPAVTAGPPQPLKNRCRPGTQIVGLSHRPQSLATERSQIKDQAHVSRETLSLHVERLRTTFHVKPARSEEGSLAGDSGPPWKTRRAGCLLDDDLVGGRIGYCTAQSHTQEGQPVDVPSGRISPRRFSHDQRSPHLQERCCALCRDRRRPEAAGHDAFGRSSESAPASLLGSLGYHLHSVSKAQTDHRSAEEIGPVGSRVEQDPLGVWPHQC